ncbi:MAG: putative metal-binding membrane protein [Paracoccaceae bacterium]|jgi:predicted metal-binding membrane protein
MRLMFARYSNQIEWLGFFSLILLAWTILYAMQPGAADAEILKLYGADLWAAFCAPLTGRSTFAPVFLMWVLMSAAMMAPTFVPTMKTYRDLAHTSAADTNTTAALLAGYFVIWIGFSAVAAAAQLWLARLGLIDVSGASVNWGLTAVLFLVAGAYQFSPLKEACLSKCRAPLTFFLGNWQPGAVGAARMGVQLGLICLGCCWALMSLGFVGGVMNLVWMGVATLLMVIEKLPDLGRYITRPLGILLLAGGIFSSLNAFGI